MSTYMYPNRTCADASPFSAAPRSARRSIPQRTEDLVGVLLFLIIVIVVRRSAGLRGRIGPGPLLVHRVAEGLLCARRRPGGVWKRGAGDSGSCSMGWTRGLILASILVGGLPPLRGVCVGLLVACSRGPSSVRSLLG